eukprot:3656319-Rhodomonas_salina.1
MGAARSLGLHPNGPRSHVHGTLRTRASTAVHARSISTRYTHKLSRPGCVLATTMSRKREWRNRGFGCFILYWECLSRTTAYKCTRSWKWRSTDSW